MLGHLHPHRRQVEYLPTHHAHHLGCRAGRCSTTTSADSTWNSAAPGVPGCLPGRRPDDCRSDRGGGLPSPSDDGGLDEFREFSPNRRRNSATCACNASICAACVWI